MKALLVTLALMTSTAAFASKFGAASAQAESRAQSAAIANQAKDDVIARMEAERAAAKKVPELKPEGTWRAPVTTYDCFDQHTGQVTKCRLSQ